MTAPTTDPDGYSSTLEAQGFYRDKDGKLTHPIAQALLRWWRSLPGETRQAFIDYSEQRRA